MLTQILFGAVIISLSVVIQVVFATTASNLLTSRGTWLAAPPYMAKAIYSTIITALWLTLGLSLNACLWSLTFVSLNALESFEESLYFSIVTFTTLGYGDITISESWRILASLTAVNGLIIFGLNTAFLVEFTSQLRKAQEARC